MDRAVDRASPLFARVGPTPVFFTAHRALLLSGESKEQHDASVDDRRRGGRSLLAAELATAPSSDRACPTLPTR